MTFKLINSEANDTRQASAPPEKEAKFQDLKKVRTALRFV